MNILETKAYQLTDEEKVSVIKHWLGQEGLPFIMTFTNYEKEKCKMAEELYDPSSEIHITPQYNSAVTAIKNSQEKAINPLRNGWVNCGQH